MSYLIQTCLLICLIFTIPAILFGKSYIVFITQDILFQIYLLRFFQLRYLIARGARPPCALRLIDG